MTTATTPTLPRRWFAEPMVWLVLALPASAVLAGTVTAVLAWHDADGPVADDTYRKGLAINEEIARSAHAQDLGLAAVIDGGFNDGDEIVVRLSAQAALPPEAALELRLVHPGRRDADRLARLARTRVSADGREADYVGRIVAGSAAGRDTAWRIVLAGRSWRLDGDAATGDSAERVGRAGPSVRLGAQ